MTRLSRRFLQEKGSLAPTLSGGLLSGHPEKVIQFGEGNFLRGFADWMIDMLNEQGLFKGRVVVVQPRHQDRVAEINAQDGLYTVLLRGIRHGVAVESRRLITAVSRGLSARAHWMTLVEAFVRPGIRFVISNTTEAGIAYVPEPCWLSVCPQSFPAQVTALLYHRFLASQGNPAWGMVFLPCELIEQNGATLRRHVLQHATAWGLGGEFVDWVSRHHHFLNTMVDRIVSGFPHTEADQLGAELGYEDRLMVAGEPYHLWVIEGPRELAEEIPFHQAGLNVVWVDDLSPYRTRKVRILNGTHTACVLAAFLSGLDTVGEMMDDPLLSRLVRKVLFDEILPVLSLPGLRKEKYAGSVVERLRNPFVRHELLSISLNSVSKWRVRVLPSLLDHLKSRGSVPPALAFSLAALILFYKGARLKQAELTGWRGGATYPIRDEPQVLDFFERCWNRWSAPGRTRDLAAAVLGHTQLWAADLNNIPGLTDRVAEALALIETHGLRHALESLVLRTPTSIAPRNAPLPETAPDQTLDEAASEPPKPRFSTAAHAPSK
jgi:tagaturonate reductase